MGRGCRHLTSGLANELRVRNAALGRSDDPEPRGGKSIGLRKGHVKKCVMEREVDPWRVEAKFGLDKSIDNRGFLSEDYLSCRQE